jgi:GTP-binding protein YchF
MGFKCGIVGLPNVGKSTLFNALTRAEIQAENYPFCTIEPNTGMVEVPDDRLRAIANIAGSAKTIPTLMEFVDIAGLVAGASKGEGLGNQFLGHIRSVQAVAHVTRCFEDDNVTHVNGKIDPLDDIQTIETELALADLQTLEKAQIKLQKLAKAQQSEAKKELETCHRIIELLNDNHSLSQQDDADIHEMAKKYQLITAKPYLYVANVNNYDNVDSNSALQSVLAYAKEKKAPVIIINASLEAELSVLSPEEQTEFLQELGLKQSGLDKLIAAGHTLLDLETFYTAGPKESRAWSVRKNATAPQAAGVIHTDFESHFIRAEVIRASDYIEHHGEAGVKKAGKWRLEGKEYQVQDGDILVIRANA